MALKRAIYSPQWPVDIIVPPHFYLSIPLSIFLVELTFSYHVYIRRADYIMKII